MSGATGPTPRGVPWPAGHRPTPFQRAVVEAVRSLRRGELTTYGELATEVGRPRAAQAVANVVRSAPDLPWWRVLPSDGRLYCTHVERQAPLLRAEGHDVDTGGRVRPRRDDGHGGHPGRGA